MDGLCLIQLFPSVRCLVYPTVGDRLSTSGEISKFRARLAATLRRFGSVAEMARAVGVSDNAIYKWVAGRGQPSVQSLVAIARTAGVSVEWLATGREVATSTAQSAMPSDFVFLGAGRPRSGRAAILNSAQLVDYVAFRSEWIRRRLGVNPETVALVEAVGDAMAPTLHEGDLALADFSHNHIHHDGLYVLLENNDLLVKRVQWRQPGRKTVVVRSDNPAYEAQEVAAESLRIAGRVAWIGRRP